MEERNSSKNIATGLWFISSLNAEVLHVAKEHLRVSHLLLVFAGEAVEEEQSRTLCKKFDNVVVNVGGDVHEGVPKHIEECFSFMDKGRQNGVVAVLRSTAANIVVACYLLHTYISRTIEDAWTTIGEPSDTLSPYTELLKTFCVPPPLQHEGIFKRFLHKVRSFPKKHQAKRGEKVFYEHIPENNVAQSLEELPPAAQNIVANWNLPPDQVKRHFSIVLSLLRWETRKQFSLPPGQPAPPVPVQPVYQSGYNHKTPEELLASGKGTDPRKLYKMHVQAGKGGFGTVYAARNVQTKERVAIKRMPSTSTSQREFNLREVSYLDFCAPCANIVRYHTCYEVQEEIWVVMDYMEGGTLREASRNFYFEEPQIAYVAREMLKALVFLHSYGLVHRDLKTANVMMTIQGDVKLIDFGLCTCVAKGPRIKMCGSPMWMAPEMIQRKAHTCAADVWSFGVCMLELANRQNNPAVIVGNCTPIQGMFKIATEGISHPFHEPNNWSPSFKSFISLCLMLDPDKRATSTNLLLHPFINTAETRAHMAEILSSIFIQNVVTSII